MLIAPNPNPSACDVLCDCVINHFIRNRRPYSILTWSALGAGLGALIATHIHEQFADPTASLEASFATRSLAHLSAATLTGAGIAIGAAIGLAVGIIRSVD